MVGFGAENMAQTETASNNPAGVYTPFNNPAGEYTYIPPLVVCPRTSILRRSVLLCRQSYGLNNLSRTSPRKIRPVYELHLPADNSDSNVTNCNHQRGWCAPHEPTHAKKVVKTSVEACGRAGPGNALVRVRVNARVLLLVGLLRRVYESTAVLYDHDILIP